MKKLIYILPLLLSMVSCDWNDVGYVFLGDYVHEKDYYWEPDTTSHYDTVMVDGHFTLGYYDNGKLVKEVKFLRDEQIVIDSCGYDIIGGDFAWKGYVNGRSKILYPGDSLIPNQNLKLDYYYIHGVTPDKLEMFFQKARLSNDPEVHYLKLREVRMDDFKEIREIIYDNKDFYLYLTICGYSSGTKIPENAFACGLYSNHNIKTLTLNNIGYLQSSAFKDMKSLKKVTVNCDLKTIGEDAFANCSSLTEVYLKCEPPKLKSKKCFRNTNSQLTISVSSTYYKKYLEAEYWKDMKIKKK